MRSINSYRYAYQQLMIQLNLLLILHISNAERDLDVQHQKHHGKLSKTYFPYFYFN